ncbi:MAG: ferrous iron transport protein B [Ignavibacteriae bacterium]|nr:ferrous iron transport protein B [Ignavibacteriota bacterium]
MQGGEMTMLVAEAVRNIALIGNPNSGKTTLFNALTGLRQKVGNYPGVTVEKKQGRMIFNDDTEASLLDLPGTYSLTANSPDEKVATDILLGRLAHTATPELVVCVVDASNLQRNLYLVSQIIDRHLPVIIALNMIDVAEEEGVSIDVQALEHELGVKVVPTVATKGIGIPELKHAIAITHEATGKARQWHMPEPFERECNELIGLLQHHHKLSDPVAFHEAIMLLTTNAAVREHIDRYDPELLAHVRKDHERLDFLGIDRQSVIVESRYQWINNICARCITQTYQKEMSLSDKIDMVLTHKMWGFAIFIALMTLMFQTIFSWATVPMNLIGEGFDWFGRQATLLIPPGDLQDLIVNGAIAGVAAVVTFLPQILFLFLFLGLLEDTGYMARAAFIMDRLMSKVGLHGKSFIPLLSSFACAIPGIMATRTIENPKDRLVTMLVAPLISCSARLPVYTLLIAAFIPNKEILGFLSLAGLTMLSMYLLGLIAALSMAWLFKKTLLKSAPPIFIMELPPYRMPSLKAVFLQMWERSGIFLKRAGTIILGVSVILWFLASYPKLENVSPAEQLKQSFAGRTGRLIEPLIKPLGFDWKIGIGLVGSILQREVFVSTMGTIYNIQNAADNEGSVSLRQQLQQDRDPVTGTPTFTALTAICLMVYYVLAMQCMSTVAVMRRETNGWKWPLFQIGYMTALAYSVTFIVYRAGLAIGFGGA